ncbi:hypothetical protein ASPFODRAFT_47556 [Aspergillus luchuensis CBS 106.47]|uniref:Uncharacterized protein n=1 Tax=Aspergillus luchuensis (strain CBS 106.47) TaxID=1137211 RepID=A0A1M3TE22_ASPLC|nr:hypothetical protein ASPFODRAFT_47556 [Aspergillus luchuensis CBS 106.47]
MCLGPDRSSEAAVLALGTNYEYNPFASSFWEGMGLTRTMIWLYGHTDDAGWTPVGIGLDHQDQSQSRLSSTDCGVPASIGTVPPSPRNQHSMPGEL